MLRPPSNPQLLAPLAGGGRRPPNPVAGALMADGRTVMVAARVTPAAHAGWRNKAEAVIAHLVSFERSLLAVARFDRDGGDAH